jgi:hypothetical protein
MLMSKRNTLNILGLNLNSVTAEESNRLIEKLHKNIILIVTLRGWK